MHISEIKDRLCEVISNDVQRIIHSNVDNFKIIYFKRKVKEQWGDDVSKMTQELCEAYLKLFSDYEILEKLIPFGLEGKDINIVVDCSEPRIEFYTKDGLCIFKLVENQNGGKGPLNIKDGDFSKEFILKISDSSDSNFFGKIKKYEIYENNIVDKKLRNKIRKSFAIINTYISFFNFLRFPVDIKGSFELDEHIESDSYLCGFHKINYISDNQSPLNYIFEVFKEDMNVLGIKNENELKYYIKICKTIKTIVKKHNIHTKGVNISTIFSQEFDFSEIPHLFFADQENRLLFKVNVTAESSIQEILNSDLLYLSTKLNPDLFRVSIKNDYEEFYKKSNFSFKDYLHNRDYIINYIKLIEY